MTNDIGPFQNIIEVGWGEPAPIVPLSDTGWQLYNEGFLDPSVAFEGGLTTWTPKLVLETRAMGQSPKRLISNALRTIVWGVPRRLTINIALIDGSGYDSGGFPNDQFESDRFTVATEYSYFQKSGPEEQPALYIIGNFDETFIVPAGFPFEIQLDIRTPAVATAKRDPESEMTVTLTWSDP